MIYQSSERGWFEEELGLELTISMDSKLMSNLENY